MEALISLYRTRCGTSLSDSVSSGFPFYRCFLVLVFPSYVRFATKICNGVIQLDSHVVPLPSSCTFRNIAQEKALISLRSHPATHKLLRQAVHTKDIDAFEKLLRILPQVRSMRGVDYHCKLEARLIRMPASVYGETS